MSVNQIRKKEEAREKQAIVVAVLFLVLGVVVLWVVKSLLNIEGEITYVALLFVPVLVYAIYAGKLESLKTPGGLEAKFVKVAQEEVNPASEKIALSVEDIHVVEKGGIRVLDTKVKNLNRAQPIIMVIQLGKHNYYTRDAVQAYLDTLLQFPNFNFVVFVDEEKSFVAYMSVWAFANLIRQEQLGFEFIDVVNQGDKDALFRYPGIIGETIHTQSTNVDALREMTRQNLEALVVIDENGKLKGIVEREQILSRMMLALAQ